jgi:glycosyltransferase involved in cell wall biosynthesis
MKIGVVVVETPHGGGGFQYELSEITKLISKNQYTVAVYSTEKASADEFRKVNIPATFIKNDSLFDKIRKWIILHPTAFKFLRSVFKLVETSLEKQMRMDCVDIVYFLSPNHAAMYMVQLPFMITIWDLAHRDHPEFPEKLNSNSFAENEAFLRKTLPRASAVFVDSPLGKETLCYRYGIDNDKVVVKKFQQTFIAQNRCLNSLDYIKKFNISKGYIFYPAQFWPHKNHIYILNALKILKEEHNLRVNAVFCGSNKGNFNYLKRKSEDLGVSNQINFLGYVENEGVAALYQEALALVMPTFFGPTNLPPIEAFALGCPVIYSDMDGLREQVGNAALLCNLNAPSNLAILLKRLLTENGLREQLIEYGKNKISELGEVQNSGIVDTIIAKIKYKLMTYKDV